MELLVEMEDMAEVAEVGASQQVLVVQVDLV
jgi:hypothetical protein